MSRRLSSADAYWDTLGRENSVDVEDTVRVTGFFRPTPDQNAHLVNHIDPSVIITCPDVTIGVGVTIERGTRINADKLVIGDFAYIGDHVTLRAPEVRIDDYARVNALTYGGGRKPLSIGRNVYLGRGVYLDSNGGLTLEDNTLAGMYSILITHIQGGDLTYGGASKLHQEWPLVLRKDAWLIGRVEVYYAREIGARAMVKGGSAVWHDIPADTTWAGDPATDVTEKLGRQFEAIDDEQRHERLEDALDQYTATAHSSRLSVAICLNAETVEDVKSRMDGQFNVEKTTFFNVAARTYTKRRTAGEVEFIRWMLAHDLGKWTPDGES